MITLAVASLPVAYLMDGRFRKKALVVLVSAPLALVANVARLNVTAILAHAFGEKVTRGWPHTLIGVVIVLVAFSALYGLSNALSGDAAQKKRSAGTQAG